MSDQLAKYELHTCNGISSIYNFIVKCRHFTTQLSFSNEIWETWIRAVLVFLGVRLYRLMSVMAFLSLFKKQDQDKSQLCLQRAQTLTMKVVGFAAL